MADRTGRSPAETRTRGTYRTLVLDVFENAYPEAEAGWLDARADEVLADVRREMGTALLRDAVLSAARLDAANLFGADLTEAQQDGASLVGAKLTLTVLTGAALDGADLTGTRLRETILDHAVWTDATRWPDDAAALMRQRSETVRPGVYRIRPGSVRPASPAHVPPHS